MQTFLHRSEKFSAFLQYNFYQSEFSCKISYIVQKNFLHFCSTISTNHSPPLTVEFFGFETSSTGTQSKRWVPELKANVEYRNSKFRCREIRA